MQFTTYGIRAPLLSPVARGSEMTTQDRKIVTGPDLQEIEVNLSGAAYARAVE